jgi:hypothetical protein
MPPGRTSPEADEIEATKHCLGTHAGPFVSATPSRQALDILSRRA